MFVPETVFFKDDGKIDFMTTVDRDFCIAYDTKTKLENLPVRKKLVEIGKERRNDFEMYSRQKAASEKLKKASKIIKQGKLTHKMLSHL